MIHRRIASAIGVLCVLASGFVSAAPVKVVTSFSVLEDLVKQVGGEQVELTNLVGANGDAHVYHPAPADAQAVTHADLLVINGLGFEGWMERLVEAAEFKGVLLVATDGIDVIHLEHDEAEHDEEEHHHEASEEQHAHHHGEYDPHAWHSVTNVQVYVSNILEALSKLAPENKAYYEENASRYLARLKQLEVHLKEQMAQVPVDKRHVITSHDAFNYLAKEYGFLFTAPQGMSTESEASAADVVSIIKQIREQDIQAVFVENISNPRLIEQIARETGLRVGGQLYSDALSSSDQPAATYVDMMQYNISTLVSALK